MTQQSQYKGYLVHAAATPLHNGLYAATLQIEKPAEACASTARFPELDYFFEEEQALAYATRWGRLWIDNKIN